MTAEVVIMNKSGIALAADSAVTYIPETQQPHHQRKIFHLSGQHDIALMVHGRLTINGIPITTLVDIFKKSLPVEAFDHTADYLTAFHIFLQKNKLITTHQDTRISWLYQALNYLPMLQKNLIHDWHNSGTETSLSVFFLKSIDVRLEKLEQQEDTMEICRTVLRKKIIKAFKESPNIHLSDFFSALTFNTHLKEKIITLLTLLTLKQDTAFGGSGLVFTGFGTQDIFPSLHHSHVSGLYFDTLKAHVLPAQTITTENQSQIIPFGQTDTIHDFLSGIHPGFKNEILKAFEHEISIIRRSKELDEITVQNHTERFHNRLKSYAMQQHIAPAVNHIKLFPVQDLSTIARQLIHMSALKSHLNPNGIHIGGPVISAELSKTSGFQWSAKNPQISTDATYNAAP